MLTRGKSGHKTAQNGHFEVDLAEGEINKMWGGLRSKKCVCIVGLHAN